MTHVWGLAALWLGLALVATLLSIWLRVATALSEIVVGTIAQLIIGVLVGASVLGTGESWITFLSGAGAIVLTFLAGAELDPTVLKTRLKEAAEARGLPAPSYRVVETIGPEHVKEFVVAVAIGEDELVCDVAFPLADV